MRTLLPNTMDTVPVQQKVSLLLDRMDIRDLLK